MDLMGGFLLMFTILKLVGVIDWSWWWVTAPLWVPALLALVFFVWAYLRERKP
jgi:hypothetical protein